MGQLLTARHETSGVNLRGCNVANLHLRNVVVASNSPSRPYDLSLLKSLPKLLYVLQTIISLQNECGREDELNEIHEAVQSQHTATSYLCICGVKGIGKTELARLYAHKY